MMDWWQGLMLGALQGVAEFLPISSSGHLLVLRNLLGLGDVPVLFDVLLHLATLLAIFIVFRKKIGSIISSLLKFSKSDKNEADNKNIIMVGMILIGTLITGVIGVLIQKLEVDKYPKFTFLFFIVTGLILFFLHVYKGKQKESTDLSTKRMWFVGCFTGFAQGLGVFPGISRSGITISASRLAGMSQEEAGEYSFLIAIPAILGAVLLDLKDAGNLFDSVTPFVLVISIIASFLVGLVSLTWLLRLLKKGKLYYFSFYLIPLGVLGLIFF
ncbi:undecaprenyl-diphosphate phosphatase [Spirochaeta cellobiosiphila]|uniref:undecaprenyl-diphosphate phosphatase n=1 Tax=Spirochaeta cellobiosiphila TaxID=504483 RepID=UPI0003FADCAD|nr:undecaprenyl-diphosphate phosphatase [Spirochaeta cellobiosiphila]